MNHTLTPAHLLILAEQFARVHGVGLRDAYGIAPKTGERVVDLLYPRKHVPGVMKEVHDEVL